MTVRAALLRDQVNVGFLRPGRSKFCWILLVRALTEPTRLKEREYRPPLLLTGRDVKDSVATLYRRCISILKFFKKLVMLLSKLSYSLESIAKFKSSSEKHKQPKRPSIWNHSFHHIMYLLSISFWGCKVSDFFLCYLKFLGFEFYFCQTWMNLDFYLIIYGLELTVRLKSDKASDTTEILCSFWFMDNEFAILQSKYDFLRKKSYISY